MKNRYRYMMVIMVLVTMLSALYTYTQVNDEIAVHWGVNGEADGYAPKQLLLLFPFLIPALDYLLKLLFRLEPRKRNMQKSSAGYAVIRLVIGAILCVCTIFTCLEALYPKTISINIVAPFMVGIMIMIIGNVLPKIHSNYIIGIRNPWTLENEDIWRKTQRLSGRLWFGGGALICILALVLPDWYHILLIIIIFVMILLPNLYAFYLYQQMRKEKAHD